MGWTITIGRVAGTEVKVHLTFFILVAFWAIAMGTFQVVAAIALRRELDGEFAMALGGVA